MVFYIAAIIYVFGAIVYGTFASSETQQWSLDNDHEDDYIEGRESQIQARTSNITATALS